MKYDFEQIQHLFELPDEEGRDKTTALGDAITEFTEPNQYIHFGAAANLPYGFVYELTRQYWGKNPEFTLSCLGASSNIIIPLSSTLFHNDKRVVKRIITTYAGDIYPAPSPSKIMQKIYKEGKITVDNYSLLSMVLRFFAGALNLPFIPIETIKNTSIEAENPGAVKRIQNPFYENKQELVLKPLNPDIAYMHGIWADKYGNTILMPPYTGYMWGVLAASKIIISVEKIVPTEVIRKYNHLVRIPGHRVSAVVQIPFGAHPSANRGIAGVDYGYAEDYDFIVKWQKASRYNDQNYSKLKEWLDEWVLKVDESSYLDKLGEERLKFLENKAKPDFWKTRIKDALNESKIDFSAPSKSTERMTALMAEVGAQRIKENGYETILAGQGLSNLAAWLCHKKLLKQGINVELMAEVGFYGYYPRPGSPFIFEFANFPTCKSLGGVFNTLVYNIQGFRSRNIGFLGAGQVDRTGNINSTKAGKYYLVGSGGAADVCGCSKEVIVCLKHSALRLLKRVPYITGVGSNINTVITDMGVLEKSNGGLVLTHVFKTQDQKPIEKIIKKISRSTGWKLESAENIKIVGHPDPEDLAILRLYDINKNFLR